MFAPKYTEVFEMKKMILTEKVKGIDDTWAADTCWWNRTIKERMWKMFSARNDTTYIDKLKEILASYNNKKHSSIGMTPVQASKKENERKVYANLYEDELWRKRKFPKFKVGDKVRITVKKKSFEKGFTPKWTEEVFIVKKVIYTKPVTYKLKDLMDDEVDGTFYEPELQKTAQEKRVC